MPYSADGMLASKIAYSARNSAGRIYPSLRGKIVLSWDTRASTCYEVFPKIEEIDRQLFAGHVVGSRPMKRKDKINRMII